MKTQKIDIIVPCYNAQETLPRLLGSIISQVIVEDLEVTLVNDAGDNDYKKIVEQFSPFVKIKEVKLKKNGGPAVARQYGFDKSENPLVTFIDADDTFAGAYVLKVLREQLLSESHNAICIGNFAQELDNTDITQFALHNNDTVWMFGKLYKRDFLTKHNIRFNETRANEDNGFNMLCKLMSNENEQIKFIQDVIYYWHTNENSITRINNCQYSYDQSFVGYTDNMIWAFKEAEKRNPFNGIILYEKMTTLINLYEYWIETVARDTRFIEQNWASCLKYYKEIYREIKDKIPNEAFNQAYNNVMRNCYMGDKLNGIIPVIGIQEFMQKLENDYLQQESIGDKEQCHTEK